MRNVMIWLEGTEDDCFMAWLLIELIVKLDFIVKKEVVRSTLSTVTFLIKKWTCCHATWHSLKRLVDEAKIGKNHMFETNIRYETIWYC